ncbi:MerR family transcriptional regulator [Shouchella clausii]|uniref:MerR family transcriptional regulator n=1 Tax=Shouchella TaxID=2893057 RepID=UPI0004E6AEEC|nr:MULTISPECIES: MerR family transcriptional regulator [Shouchella]ALA53264.1 regulatory protein, MerR [Shouchella clausii]MBU3231201.1 MerR family transcriptional regulator [Shouchella clausii]MBU3263795.1 MerR family transcriptional regulator [Shouchella clausii]MBU3508243.1 MerR family transcriptional regulator [Shouchella clausii]MBU3534256.1 MerR family transcriptional regulator [Shouchella clausii]
MKISEVAKTLNLPISTIRYYEKMGIVPEHYVTRDEKNYRHYDETIIHHLQAVKTLLAVGFSIGEVRSMIERNGFTKEEHTRILQAKIEEIEEAQRKLEQSKQYLYDILASDISCEKGFGQLG